MVNKKKYGNISGVINPTESVIASNMRKWHKSESIDYWPTENMNQNNLDSVLDQLFYSYGPSAPIFNNNDKLLTMGSCFALRIREWMERNGKGSETVFIPEGLNNSFAVRQYIEWALTGNRSHDAYWYDETKDGVGKWESPTEQKQIKEEFNKHSGFVITFGLAEVWRDKETGGVFWRGVPNDVFDPKKHESVVSKVQDNIDNIKTIISLIRTHCGNKPIIITLSPVPLNATFQQRPCIVSDCVSKSILRVAVDEALRDVNDKNVYYWPSFEYVKWIPSHMPIVTFGGTQGKKIKDSRHVADDAVSNIISNFSKKFFQ